MAKQTYRGYAQRNGRTGLWHYFGTGRRTSQCRKGRTTDDVPRRRRVPDGGEVCPDCKALRPWQFQGK